MSLSDVLNNLTGARDALVTAINGKGGSVAASATLRQCAEAVTALPEGGESTENDPVFDGLIFYLSFDRWMIDSISDLKIPFADVEAEPGKNDLCGYFDGINSWAAIPKEKISIRGRSEWSVGFWFKPEQLTQTVINPVYAEWNESDYGSARFSVQLTNELKVFSGVNFTDGQEEVDLLRAESVESLSIGTWYFIAVTVDLISKKMVLYIDGLAVANSTNEAAPDATPNILPYNDIQIMNWFTGQTNPSAGGHIVAKTSGSIDEFAFWGRALSATEVSHLYNGGDGLFYKKIESGDIYTGDLVATVRGSSEGTLSATLTCQTPNPTSQDDVVWEGVASGSIDYHFSVNTFSGKWGVLILPTMMGDVPYGGDTFETENSVPWGATWTNTGGTSRTCEVSKA